MNYFKIIVPLLFFWFSIAVQLQSQNVTIFQENNKYGLKNEQGTKVQPPIYDRIYESERTGYYLVHLDKKVGVFNSKGQLILPIDYDGVVTRLPKMFIVTKAQKKGILSEDGQLLIPLSMTMLCHWEKCVFKQQQPKI